MSEKTNEKVVDVLERLNSKVDSFIKSIEEILKVQTETLSLLKKSLELRCPPEPVVIPDALALLSLPSSLRKTMFALQKLGEATAEDLSMETKRLRAVESACANQLTRMRYLKKKRVGRKVYFYSKKS